MKEKLSFYDKKQLIIAAINTYCPSFERISEDKQEECAELILNKLGFKKPKSRYFKIDFELSKAVESLKLLCYKEIPNFNGGDNDSIIVDDLRKEWTYWENGFGPFALCGEQFPNNHNLNYWQNNRK